MFRINRRADNVGASRQQSAIHDPVLNGGLRCAYPPYLLEWYLATEKIA